MQQKLKRNEINSGAFKSIKLSMSQSTQETVECLYKKELKQNSFTDN